MQSKDRRWDTSPEDSASSETEASSRGSTAGDNAWPGSRDVILFACLLCLANVAEGYDIGVINGVVVRIQDDLHCSTLATSLFVSFAPLFVMVGAPLGGALADLSGRWGALLLTGVLLTVGPLAMAAAPDVGLLIAARACVGLGVGMGFVVVSMYIAEVAPSRMRGALTAMEDVALNVGALLGYCMNWWLLGLKNDWRWMLGLGSVLSLLLVLGTLIFRVPESPRWLFLHGRVADAQQVLDTFLSPAESQETMRALCKQQQQQRASDEPFVTWAQLLCLQERHMQRMVLACITVGVAQTACGNLVVAYYSSEILKSSMTHHGAFAATSVMGLIKLLVVVFVMFTLDRTGRRQMLIMSLAVTLLSCLWLVSAFGFRWGWFAQAAGFSLFMAGYSLGLGPLTWTYTSEAFGNELRGKGMGLALFFSRAVGTCSTLFFPSILERIGPASSFALLAVANAVLLVLVVLLVVETHGRSLEDMRDLFADKGS